MAKEQIRGSSHGLAAFMWRHKFWWLIPLIVLALALAVIMVIVQAGSETPFQYPKY